jgi:hypothetical protein
MYNDKLLFRYYRYTLGSSINYSKLLFLGARADNQNKVGKYWEDNPNWSACDEEAKLAKPTLVITGTDDNEYMPHIGISASYYRPTEHYSSSTILKSFLIIS